MLKCVSWANCHMFYSSPCSLFLMCSNSWPKHSIYSSSGYPKPLCDLVDSDAFGRVELSDHGLIALAEFVAPATNPTSRPGSLQTSICPFTYQVSLELSHGRKHIEHQDAARCCGVHLLCQRLEADPHVLQPVHDINQVLDTAPQTVKLPHHQHITLPKDLNHPIELRPAGLRT